jgi:hypothetical protein
MMVEDGAFDVAASSEKGFSSTMCLKASPQRWAFGAEVRAPFRAGDFLGTHTHKFFWPYKGLRGAFIREGRLLEEIRYLIFI